MKIIKAYTKYPFLFSMFVLVFIVLLTEATAIPLRTFFEKMFDLQTAYYLTETLVQGICAILLAVFIARSDILHHAGLSKPKNIKQLWIVWPILALALINGWSFFDGSIVINTSRPFILFLFVLIALSTGFYEEILCRGLILSACLKKWGKTKKGIYLAVLVSSLVFGLPCHFTNFVMNRGSLLEVSTQMLYAVFFGVFFAACFLRFNSLWPAILTHTVFDMMGTLNQIAVGNRFTSHVPNMNYSLTDALSTILITLPLFIYGLFLLSKVKSNVRVTNQENLHSF